MHMKCPPQLHDYWIAGVMGGATYIPLESVIVKPGTQCKDYILQLFIFLTQIEEQDQKISAFGNGYLYNRHRLFTKCVICN